MGDVNEAAQSVEVNWEVPLDFVNGIVDALAWPVAIFAVAFLFRREFRNIASSLKRVKWGDAEAEFDQGVAEAKEVAKTLDPVNENSTNENDKQTYTLLQQAEVSPTGAVIEAYKKIEEQLAKIFEISSNEVTLHLTNNAQRWSDPRRMPPTMLSRYLHKAGWLSHAESRMLERLRETRNLAAHDSGGSISSESAKDFVRLAGALVDALESKRKSLQA